MILSTKQVDNIAISENLFHDVVEEHIPNLIRKQTEMLNTFFDNLTSFIEDYLKKTDWFYIENKNVLYNNSIVALFPDLSTFPIGSCPLNHAYDPVTFQDEFEEYTGTLMTANEFKKAFAGKFDILYEYCPEYLADSYFTVMDFHKALHADGIHTKRWNGFSKANSYHIPLYRLNGMDSETICAAKRFISG